LTQPDKHLGGGLGRTANTWNLLEPRNFAAGFGSWEWSSILSHLLCVFRDWLKSDSRSLEKPASQIRVKEDNTMPTRTLRNVPDSEVDQVVSDFESEGANVERTQNPDGTWTVTATFPDRS
jgi:hypothetical protein